MNPESMSSKIVAFLSDTSVDVKAILLGLACDVESLREEVATLKEQLAQYKEVM